MSRSPEDVALEAHGAPRSGSVCEGCGQSFEPRRTNQRHCGAPCRARASRQRKARERESARARFDLAVRELVAAASEIESVGQRSFGLRPGKG